MRKYEKEEAERLHAEDWQVELLKMNPYYVFWGPHEDYMCSNGGGWSDPVFVASWKEFNWQLDELNECVNFYFEVDRENRQCEDCSGSGYAPQALRIANTFYPHQCEELGLSPDVAWHRAITQDEADALIKEKRFPPGTTAEKINTSRSTLGHDAINRWILIEARCKRLGLTLHCQTCGGPGYIFTTEKAHVSLVLWMIHPRKGCSRGVEIKKIEREDLPAVFGWLREARNRNQDRFGKLSISL